MSAAEDFWIGQYVGLGYPYPDAVLKGNAAAAAEERQKAQLEADKAEAKAQTPAGSTSSGGSTPAANANSNAGTISSTLTAGTSGMDIAAALNPANLFPINPFSPPQGVTLSAPAGKSSIVFVLIAAGLVAFAFFGKKLL